MQEPKTGPSVNRHRSEQVVETPEDFLSSVRHRFGHITWDLAATKDNAKAFEFFTPEVNSLDQPWHKLDGWLWLNPPFDPITPWVRKCSQEAALGAKILLLCPTSIGANWWRDHIHEQACVLMLQPRLQFVGHTHKFPKDLALCVYNGNIKTYGYWRWPTKSITASELSLL